MALTIAGEAGVMAEEDFGTIVAPLLDPGFRLAMVMLGDRGAAEDAVQEAAVKAWRGWDRLRGGRQALRPWFLSIVANECRMTRRRRWWTTLRLAELPAARRSDGAGEEELELRAAIRKLPAADQLPLFLFYYLDLPLEEVARVLGVSRGAARSRLYRAVARLRPELADQEVPE
jgi:RNA polymerase sigma factor (sigma-70 family)